MNIATMPLMGAVHAFRVFPKALALLLEASPKALWIAIFSNLMRGFIPVILGVLGKWLIDRLIAGEGFSSVVQWLLVGQLGVAVLGQVLMSLSEYQKTVVRDSLSTHLSLKVAAHAASLDLEFFEMPGNYDAFAKAKNEMDFRPFFMAFTLIDAVESIFTVAGFVAVVFVFQPLLGLALLLAALPTLFAASKSGGEMFELYDSMTPEGRRASYAEELLTNDLAAKEVRLYQLAPRLLSDLRRYLQGILKSKLEFAARKYIRFGAAGILGTAAQYAATAFVVYRVGTGAATIGDFSLLMVAILGVRSGLDRAFTSLGEMFEHSLFLGDLTRFLAQKPQIAAPLLPQVTPSKIAQGLKLEHVRFAYPGSEKAVFEDLNLELRVGETTALVGINGAGKTTLVKLLTRLYDPQHGAVKLDGIDVREFNPLEYRQRFGVILQDFTRYKLSVFDNIAFGDISQVANLQRLESVARDAGALELIKGLPEGWETMLGRQFHVRGQDLSGGQWQRVALARALYRDAPVLLLDEPSAALDAEAEMELFERYKELVQNKLSLLITHRFNTVKMADRIVVLEHGKILEDGSHNELMRLNGRYAEMFEAQASGYQTQAL